MIPFCHSPPSCGHVLRGPGIAAFRGRSRAFQRHRSLLHAAQGRHDDDAGKVKPAFEVDAPEARVSDREALRQRWRR